MSATPLQLVRTSPMHDDPLIELIARQSMSRLNEMEAELEQTANRAKFELDLVRRARALKRTNRIVSVVSSDSGEAREAETVRTSSLRRRGNGRSSKRAPIKQLMGATPGRVWRPAEMSRALAEQGIELSRDATRVTMTRMAEDNELQKLGDGEYVLARQFQPASDPASPAAPGRANGENREMTLTDGSSLGAR